MDADIERIYSGGADGNGFPVSQKSVSFGSLDLTARNTNEIYRLTI